MVKFAFIGAALTVFAASGYELSVFGPTSLNIVPGIAVLIMGSMAFVRGRFSIWDLLLALLYVPIIISPSLHDAGFWQDADVQSWLIIFVVFSALVQSTETARKMAFSEEESDTKAGV